MPNPKTATAPLLSDLGLTGDRPLVMVDVDEVLGFFMQGFGAFLESRGYEFRVERFALFQNIWRPGAPEHLPLTEGRLLFDDFFATGCGEMEPVPGAAEALARLSRSAEVLILTNAPEPARALRAAWLARHGLPTALVLNTGPKGPVGAALAAQTPHPTAFVDDLIPNLDSVFDCSPMTATFQHVADETLRPLAPRSDRHPRIDDWPTLAEAIERALR